MLKNVKKSKEQGFTIIEVLIVLAIAGLIMLVVFLAIPALNRNSRNTRIDSDASKASGVLQEVVNNAPGGIAPAGTTVPSQLSTAEASYAQISAVNYNVSTSGFQTLGSGDIAKDTVYIRNYSVCTVSTNGLNNVGATGGTQRQYTVTYLVEAPGAAAEAPVPADFAAKCVQV